MINYPFTLEAVKEKNDEVMKDIRSRVEKILAKVKRSKKETKLIAFDPVCQYFLTWRFYLGNQYLEECKTFSQELKGFLCVIDYITEDLKTQDFMINDMHRQTKFKLEEWKKLGSLEVFTSAVAQQPQSYSQSQPKIQSQLTVGDYLQKVQKFGQDCVKLLANLKQMNLDLSKKLQIPDFKVIDKILEKMRETVEKQQKDINEVYLKVIQTILETHSREQEKLRKDYELRVSQDLQQVQSELEQFLHDAKSFIDLEKMDDNYSLMQQYKKKVTQAKKYIEASEKKQIVEREQTQKDLAQLTMLFDIFNFAETIFENTLFSSHSNIDQIEFILSDTLNFESQLPDMR